MGYDFDFLGMPADPQPRFPHEPRDGSPVVPGKLPWAAFRAWLYSLGGRPNGGDDCVYVLYPDGGSICFTGGEHWISLDTHADWNEVLRAYRKLLSLEPAARIFDPQPGVYHDERSFVEFMKASGVPPDG